MNKRMSEGLEKRPWLRPFVEDGDQSLAPAERRWNEAVELAMAELEKLGIEIYKRMKTAGGMETTALVVTGKEER